MLSIKSMSKNGMTLLHEGRDCSETIAIRAGLDEKSFIKANLPNIAYDVTNGKFYFTGETKRGRYRTTLQRAIVQNAGKKKMPARLGRREDKYDFSLTSLTAA